MRNADRGLLPGRALVLLWAAAFVVSLTAAAALRAADRPGKARAAAAPSKTSDAATDKRLKIIARRFNALTEMYSKHLKSTDPITRSIATISLARMPTPEATEAILGRVRTDRDPVVRLVAWQGLLGRAKMLTDEQLKTWQAATHNMIQRSLFHGDLRIGLMEFLSAAPITPPGRKVFTDTFARANSLASSDIPTLIAMGRALKAWGDRLLVEYLIRALKSPNTAVRAELVLQAAGICPPWNRTPKAHDVYQGWWKDNKEAFTGAGRKKPAWKRLRGQYLPAPMTADDMDLKDMKWFDELELPRFRLDQFDFAIAVDASRSMGAEIERLKRDMGIIFSAMNMVSREPRIGLTAFAPGGMVKHLPLTGSGQVLAAALQKVDIMGPAGEEEWAGALAKTMTGSRWTRPGKHSKRAIVIISDEPITDPQYRRCLKLAKEGAKAGFRIYGVMIRALGKMPNNPLADRFDRTPATIDDNPAMRRRLGADKGAKRGKKKPAKGGRSWDYYQEIAGATGGKALTVRVPQGVLGLGIPLSTGAARKGPKAPKGGKGGKGPKAPKVGKGGRAAVNKDRMAIAPIYPAGGPTNRVLTMVLIDSISPEYADRIEPFVHILVAYCQKNAKRVPERRRWQTPAPMEPNHKP